METRIDHPEQVQPGWKPDPLAELPEHKDTQSPGPKAQALDKYRAAEPKLAEADTNVAQAKAAWLAAKAKRDALLDDIAGYARIMGSDPIGLLRGRGVSWTGRTRRKAGETSE